MGNIWDGSEEAEVFEKGQYMPGGFDGLVEIEKTILKETRASGMAFIVEMRVIESNLDDCAPGQKRTWFQSLKDKDIAFPAIKEWAAAVAGIDPRNKDEVEAALGPDAPTPLNKVMANATDNPDDNDFVGCRVLLETFMKETKKKTDFTVHVWKPITA